MSNELELLRGLLFRRLDEAKEEAHNSWFERRESNWAKGKDTPTWKESSEYMGFVQEWAEELAALEAHYHVYGHG